MKYLKFRLLASALLAAACMARPAHGQAPYIWVDDKGMKQLSDQPPPPSVPASRILRMPRNAQAAPLPPAAETPAVPAAASARTDAANQADNAKAPPTLAERNADYNKRQAEAASASLKSAQEAAQKATEKANCDHARSDQAALDSGVRMSTFDKDGQRSFLTDTQRTERSKQNKAVLAGCTR